MQVECSNRTLGDCLSVGRAYLYQLDLLADCRQHIFLQSVELIKASPSSTFDQSNEDTPDASEVKLAITVKHQHLQTLPTSLKTQLHKAATVNHIKVALSVNIRSCMLQHNHHLFTVPGSMSNTNGYVQDAHFDPVTNKC